MPRTLRTALPPACLTLVLLATAGCTATGTFFDPTAEIKAAVGEALDDLADQPALHITGSVHLTTGMSRFGSYDATVLHDGTAWATFAGEWDGSGTMVSVEGAVHLKLTEDLWAGMEYGPVAAEELSGWVQVPAKNWHNPGTFFRPDLLADQLRTALATKGSLDIPLPTPETIDGVEAYRIAHESGWLTVTAEAPHRFVSVDELSFFSRDLVSSAVTIGEFTIEPATDDHIDDLGDRLLEALPAMDQPYSLIGSPSVTSDNFRADCVYPAGCTVELDVTAYATSDDPYTGDLLVIFSGEVRAKSSDKILASCEKTRAVLPWKETGMSCVATPDSSHNGDVYIVAWADSVVQYTYDTEAAIEYVTGALAEATGD